MLYGLMLGSLFRFSVNRNLPVMKNTDWTTPLAMQSNMANSSETPHKEQSTTPPEPGINLNQATEQQVSVIANTTNPKCKYYLCPIILDISHSWLQMLWPPQPRLKWLQEEHKAQPRRKEPTADLLLQKQDITSIILFLPFNHLHWHHSNLCAHWWVKQILSRETQEEFATYYDSLCRTEGSMSTLALVYLLWFHSLGLHSNGLSQIFSFLYLIWPLQTSNHEEIPYGNSLISHPSPFHQHVFASWQTLFYKPNFILDSSFPCCAWLFCHTHAHSSYSCFFSILPLPCGCTMLLISVMPALDSISRFNTNMYILYASI